MIRKEHKEENLIFSYVSYEPTVMKEKLPLIVQLHGAGERGNGQEHLDRVDVHGFSKVICNEEHDCIFVMPQCPENEFWAGRVESIIKFIEYLIREYDVDEDRVYLTGLSMGGFGTWYTSMARPDLFAAIVPVCGGGMAWNSGVLKMPIWAFHGVDDPVVAVSNSDEIVGKLREVGADVTYSRVEGEGHGVWNRAYNHELLEWLLSKKRN